MSESVASLYARFRVPANIRRHMAGVSRVAQYLAGRLRKQGYKVDIRLVRRSAMLHDLFRIVDIRLEGFKELSAQYPIDAIIWKKLRRTYRGMTHGEAAYQFFSKKEPELARIITCHEYHSIMDVDRKATSWEEKLVTYADKCVMHEKIVPMKTRLMDGHMRNMGCLDTGLIDRRYFALEKEIFKAAGITSLPKRMYAKFLNGRKDRRG